MILVVGNLRQWERQGRVVPILDGFIFAAFYEVTAELLGEVQPGVVLSPLIDDAFDAIDLAEVLGGLRFGGRYRAIAGPLPNPKPVLADVRSAAPDLDFDVFILGDYEPSTWRSPRRNLSAAST